MGILKEEKKITHMYRLEFTVILHEQNNNALNNAEEGGTLGNSK